MSSPAQLAAIRRAVHEEFVEVLLTQRPVCPSCDVAPPSAVQAERVLLAEVLEGRLGRGDFGAPPIGGDMFDRLHREAFAALEVLGWPRPPDVAALAEAMRAAGNTGPLEELLSALRDTTPACARPKEAAFAVREAARRRRFSAFLREIDAELRLGRISTDEALARVRRGVSRGKGGA